MVGKNKINNIIIVGNNQTGSKIIKEKKNA